MFDTYLPSPTSNLNNTVDSILPQSFENELNTNSSTNSGSNSAVPSRQSLMTIYTNPVGRLTLRPVVSSLENINFDSFQANNIEGSLYYLPRFKI